MRLVWAAALLGASLFAVPHAHADEAALRARLDALGTIDESETDLARAARAAIDRARSDHALGNEAAGARAERIAEASIGLIERRRAHADSVARLAAAQHERDAMRARLQAARTASASDVRERERLDPAGTTP